jgi:uncharacterized membrane protein
MLASETARRTALRRDAVLCAVFLVLTVGLWFAPTGFEDRVDDSAVRCRARVLATDNSRILQFGVIKTGIQSVTMELLDGPFAGRTVDGDNQLQGRLEFDKMFSPGDTLLAVITTDAAGGISRVNPQDHYRLRLEFFLFGLFAVLLLAYAGLTGLKALLSFVFAGCVIWKILLPGLLRGLPPVPLSLAVTTVLVAAVIFLVGGIGRKGLTAFIGSMLGILVTCLMALVFADGFRLHGAIKPFAETLLYTGFGQLDLTAIFLSAIFLASSGAIMDLSMDVAASQNELVCLDPQITFGQALRSGLAVGRAVVGTMTTTLLLAYSGGYTALLMVFMAQGVPLENIFNLNYVAGEIMNTLIGSFGLVTVAPFTALVGAFVFTRRPAAAAAPAELQAEVQR